MLQFEQIGKSFSGIVALDDVTFEVATGEVHALVGENGAGKSTLMNILSGNHRDYRGRVVVDGQPLALRGPRDAQRHGIAIIHQELDLIPELSIAENIVLGREPRRFGRLLDHRRMHATARRLLDRLELDVSTRRPVHTLRVGEQQLVEIAKALSFDMRVLILDEPTSALSDTEAQRLFAVIDALRADGVTLLYISHRFEEVFAVADRITVLRDGHYIDTVDAASTDRNTLISMMVGRQLSDLFPRASSTIGDVALKVDELTLHDSDDHDVDLVGPLSMTARRGEIVGVAGLLGAGRTELLESIFGARPRRQRAGTVSIDGVATTIRSPQQAIAAGLAFVTEDRKSQSLITQHSVRHNVTLAALRRFLTAGVVRGRAESDAVARSVADLQIKTANTDAAVDTLSGGNQQKVALAKSLLTRPKVLLLDEPTRGVDVGAKAEIYALISQLAADGAAVVMASSELPELLAMCDRILVLSLGRLTAEFTAAEATQEAILEAATARIDRVAASAAGDAA